MELDICMQCNKVVYQDDDDCPFVTVDKGPGGTMHADCYDLWSEEACQRKEKQTEVA